MFSFYTFFSIMYSHLRWIDQKVNGSRDFFFLLLLLFDSDCSYTYICCFGGVRYRQFFVTLVINLANRQYFQYYNHTHIFFCFLQHQIIYDKYWNMYVSFWKNVTIYAPVYYPVFFFLWFMKPFLCENNVSTVTYFSCNFSYFHTRRQCGVNAWTVTKVSNFRMKFSSLISIALTLHHFYMCGK